MFFYRLGHIIDLSIAEFYNLSSNASYQQNNTFLLSKSDIDLEKTGSLVYKGKILGELTNLESLGQILIDIYTEEPSKKLGLHLPKEILSKEFSEKNIINLAHEIGFKKVNILTDREPNTGHFKSVWPWVCIFDFYDVLKIGIIQQTSTQEEFSKLDLGLKAGSMKRGKMNLKLALSLANLSSYPHNYAWDPFCGQGGLVFVNLLVLDKKFIATDIERRALKDFKENSVWVEKNFELDITSKILHAERLDATNLATGSQNSNIKGIVKKSEPKFEFEKTSIITEGYLGPTYGPSLPLKNTLIETLEEITKLWQKTLQEAQSLKIPEIILCLPAYKEWSETFIRIDINEIIKNTQYKQVELYPRCETIDYYRPRAKVIHQIFKLSLNS